MKKKMIRIFALYATIFSVVFLSVFYLIERRAVIERHRVELKNLSHERALFIGTIIEDNIEEANIITRSKVILDSLSKSNHSYSLLSEERRIKRIDELNAKWKKTNKSDPFIQKYLKNSVSEYLESVSKIIPGKIGEAFLTNKYGAVVATTKKLSTFKHYHKYWWKGCYNGGDFRYFIDDRGYDESVGGYVLGIVVPVLNGKRELLGILKVNFNIISALKSVIEIPSESGAKVEIVRELGKVVVAENTTPLERSVNKIVSAGFNKEEYSSIRTKEDGLDEIFAWAAVKIDLEGLKAAFGGSKKSIDHKLGNMGERWFVVSRIKTSHVLSEVNNLFMVLTSILLIVVVTILIASLPFLNRFERTLYDAQYRFLKAFDSAAHGMVLASLEGKFTKVNRSFCNITGYSEAELLNLNFKDLTYPDDLEKDVELLNDLLSGGRDSFSLEKRYYNKSGEVIWVHLSVALIKDKENKNQYVVGQIIDISDKKEYESEILRSNNELERFAYIASHDLKEPLRVISSYVEILLEENVKELDEEGEKYRNYIDSAIKRMGGLIDSLLMISRVKKESHNLKFVQSQELVEDAKSNLDVLIKEQDAKIVYDRLPEIYCNPDQLSHVFQNLITNSIKYKGDIKPEINISALRENDHYKFAIKDNGIGLDQKYQEKAFQLFSRIYNDKKSKGSGIGLSICKKIINLHSGKIWFESKKGEGTTFFFTIPYLKNSTLNNSDLG